MTRIWSLLLVLLLTICPAWGAEWTLQHSSEIQNGSGFRIKAQHLTDNFSGLKSDINDRLSKTTASGQTVTGAVTFSSEPTFSGGIKTDSITEVSSGNGVTADSVLLKDGMVTVAGTAASNGQIGYASNALQAYINGSLQTLLHGGNGLDALSDVTITTPATGHILKYNGSAWVNQQNAPYESTGQTYTSGGLLTLAHGLGVVPKRFQAYIKCTDAGGEGGYSQNDFTYVPLGMVVRGTGTATGFSLRADATNIYVRFANDSNVFYVANKSDGSNVNTTNTKWQFYILAWPY